MLEQYKANDGGDYIIALQQTANSETWYMLRTVYNGQHYGSISLMSREVARELVIGAIKTNTTTQGFTFKETSKVYGNIDRLEPIVSSFRRLFRKNYKDEHIIMQKQDTDVEVDMNTYPNELENKCKEKGIEFTQEIIEKEIYKRTLNTYDFQADDGKTAIQYRMQGFGNKGYTFRYLQFKDRENVIDMDMEFIPNLSILLAKEFRWVKDEIEERSINIIRSSEIAMDKVRAMLDLSWYEDPVTKKKKKDYVSIDNKIDLEIKIIIGMIKEFQKGEEVIIGLDTETTGVNIRCLAEDNPLKSHIVSTPIAFNDETSYVIWNDMEHFDNVDPKYMVERLRPFIERNKSKYIKVTKPDIEFPNELQEIVNKVYGEKGYVLLDRKYKTLVGHNCAFDARVFYDLGVRTYWNDDTMLMSFCLNPEGAKTNVRVPEVNSVTGKTEWINVNFGHSLKSLTHRIFKHQTAELSDLLGKGSEDKFRWIPDEEVAIMYACADADYTRQMLIYLRKLMSERMYDMYRKQDMECLNVLYTSEYYGIKVDEELARQESFIVKKDMETLHQLFCDIVNATRSKRNKDARVQIDYDNGLIDKEEYDRRMKENEVAITPNSELFDLNNNNISSAFYEVLGYPILGRTSKGAPAIGKKVRRKLLQEKLKVPNEILKEDVYSEKYKTSPKEDNILIKKDEFNGLKYALVKIIEEYKRIEKEYVSYFKPLENGNMEGKLFSRVSMTGIATRRIMCPAQTMKSSLKSLLIPYPGFYMMDFDEAQEEYRINVSQAGFTEMVEILKSSERDFHTESASMLTGVPAHEIDHGVRKSFKSVNFGIVYGLAEKGLAENIWGKATDVTMYEAHKLMKVFTEKNDKVMKKLMEYRKQSLTPRQDFTNEFKDFAGFFKYDKEGNKVYKDVGAVENALGFWRLFDLDNIDRRRKGQIERAAGNFPIQSFAAEILRMLYIRLYNRLEKEGMENDVMFYLSIHDELLLGIRRNIHPYKMYEILYEECMLTFPGHTNYFIGIGAGENWKEAKSDENEAPVKFVAKKVKEWKQGKYKEPVEIYNPAKLIMKDMLPFKINRVREVVEELCDTSKPIDMKELMKNFTNYVIRAWINDSVINYPNRPYEKKNKEDEFEAFLETILLRTYEEPKQIIDINGKLRTVKLLSEKGSRKFLEEWMVKNCKEGKEIELASGEILITGKSTYQDMEEDEELYIEEDDSYESFGDDVVYYDIREDEDDFDYDEGTLGSLIDRDKAREDKNNNLLDLVVKDEPKYNNLTVMYNRVVISCRKLDLDKAKDWIEKNRETSKGKGYSLLHKGASITPIGEVKLNSNLKELDDLLSSKIQETIKVFKKDNQLTVESNSFNCLDKVRKLLTSHLTKDGDILVTMRLNKSNRVTVGFIEDIQVIKDVVTKVKEKYIKQGA